MNKLPENLPIDMFKLFISIFRKKKKKVEHSLFHLEGIAFIFLLLKQQILDRVCRGAGMNSTIYSLLYIPRKKNKNALDTPEEKNKETYSLNFNVHKSF